MTRYMLDTDTSSYIIRKRPIEVLHRLQTAVSTGHEITISVITYAELMQGLAASQAPQRDEPIVHAFLERLHAVPDWGQEAANAWAHLYTALKRAGTPIGPQDTMIATHALSLDAVVVTNNVKHFGRVPGLRTENWIDASEEN